MHHLESNAAHVIEKKHLKSAFTKRAECRLCSSPELELVLSLPPTPPANEFVPQSQISKPQETFPLDVYFCHRCFHVQLLDIVSPDRLFSNYVYVSGTSPVFVKHFEDYAHQLCEGLASGSQVLEIGSNDGTMLESFKKRDMRILGVDPAQDIARSATERGIPTINAFFTLELAKKICDDWGQFERIVANNVFAHIDDLVDIVEGVKILLDKEGIFVFEVSYLGSVFEKTLFDTIYHEHLSYHSVLSLEPFFKRMGMRLFKVESVSTHGGSIRCFVQHQQGHHPHHQSVADFINYEKSLKLDQAATFQIYQDKIQILKSQLCELLSKLKAGGSTIIGYGAPAKATTLMYSFGLSRELISAIVDDSPFKQGLYTPGLHVPVVPANQFEQLNPDYVLILAWNFAESIIAKYQAYRQRGGKFIIPVPKVQLVGQNSH